MFKSVLAFSKRMDGYKRNRGKSFPPGYLVPSGSGHRWIHWPAMLQHLMIWCRWRHAYLQDDCLSWRLAHCVRMLTTGKTHQEKRQIHLPFRLLHPLSWTERIPHGQGCLPPATTWQCSDSIYLLMESGHGPCHPVVSGFFKESLRSEDTRTQHSTWYLSKYHRL